MNKSNIVSSSLEDILKRTKAEETRTDWRRVDAMTDSDIEAHMRDDDDWADLTDFDWSQADIVYPKPKQSISIRLDEDVVRFFKSSGKGYQTRMNAVLRQFMHQALKSDKTGR